MGVNNSKSFSYRSIGLNWEQFKYLLHEYCKHSNRGASNVGSAASNSCTLSSSSRDTRKPTIDIDGNNVAMRIKDKNPVDGLMDLAKAFVAADAHVCVIVDNRSKRYNTKREGTSRKVMREKKRLLSIEYESRLTACLQGQEDELEKESLAKALARAQNEATATLDPSFTTNLREKIELFDRAKSFMTMKIADAQADTLLAKRKGISTIICSNDSDLIIHDPDCLLLFKFTAPNRRCPDPQNLIMATGSFRTAQAVTKILCDRFDALKSSGRDIFQTPHHPIFENEKDIVCRALLANALGNDYWEKGQPNFGISKAADIMKEAAKVNSVDARQQLILNSLSEHGSKEANYGITCKQTIMAYALAFKYEPANEQGEEKTYIYDTPTSLPYYLREYKPSVTPCTISSPTESAPVLVCKFLGDETHEFLRHEGSHMCALCDSTTCRFCCEKLNGEIICMECHVLQATFILQTKSNGRADEERVMKNRRTMVEEMRQLGKNVPHNLTYLETYDLYESYQSFSLGDKECTSNLFPLEPTKQLHVENGMFSREKFQCTVKELPFACRSNRLSVSDVCNLTHLLAELVKYDTSTVKGKIYPVHKSMPRMIIDIAQGCRMENKLSVAYRILERANRHSLSPFDPTILDAPLRIGYYNNELYFDISKCVAKSYYLPSQQNPEEQLYQSRSVFCVNSLICTECFCDVGAKEKANDRDKDSEEDCHTCIHPPSIIRGLSLELPKGLADQYLVELAVRIKADGMDSYSHEQVKTDIALLASAAGVKLDASDPIDELLHDFSVATEKAKKYPGDPKPEHIRPFREVQFVSTTKKATTIVEREWQQETACHTSDAEMQRTELQVGNNTEHETLVAREYLYLCMEMLTSFENEMLRVYCTNEALKRVFTRKFPKLKQNKMQQGRRVPVGKRLVSFRKGKILNADELSNFDEHECIHQLESILSDDICGTSIQKRMHPTAGKRKVFFSNSSDASSSTTSTTTPSSSKRQHVETPSFSKVRGNIMLRTNKTKVVVRRRSPRMMQKPKKKADRRKRHHCCDMVDCPFQKQVYAGLIKVKRIPTYIEQISEKERKEMAMNGEINKSDQIKYATKLQMRKKFTDRLGLGINGTKSKKKDIRFCEKHEVEEINLLISAKVFDTEGEASIIKTRTTIVVPKPVGVKSPHSPAPSHLVNKGVAIERSNFTMLQRIHDQETVSPETIATQRFLNESLVEKLDAVENQNNKMGLNESSNNARTSATSIDPKVPKFTLEDLIPGDVHDMTGHADVLGLIETVVIICGGDLDLMTKTISKMTWLEEWVFAFQIIYFRTHSRWIDYMKTWNIRKKTARAVLQSKLKLIKDARNRWPMYATLDEDEALRNESWNDLLGTNKYRMIMHDNTNIGKLPKPSDPELNAATYSAYYNSNCVKGGVATQPCGFIRTIESYVGAVGDSEYIEKTRVLQLQEEFQNQDKLRDGSIVPFLNTFDKGYRLIMDCLRHGRQLCWQPCFRRSDRKFGSFGIHLTAVVASVRSGNERSVKMVKNSWFVKHGYTDAHHFDPELLADVWIAFGFLVNFMYDTVH